MSLELLLGSVRRDCTALREAQGDLIGRVEMRVLRHRVTLIVRGLDQIRTDFQVAGLICVDAHRVSGSRTPKRTADEDAIRDHVVSLFDAYLAGDQETLRSGRAEDWKGFQITSTRLIRGVDDYMVELEKVFGGLRVDRYEFVDFEVDVDGDLGIVYYLARDYLSDVEQDDAGAAPKTVLIRSIDVYMRRSGSWIQVGSNICAIADPLPDTQLSSRR